MSSDPSDTPEPAAMAGDTTAPPAESTPAAPLLPSAATHTLIYCCRKCRAPLFRPEQLMPHTASQHTFSYKRLAKERGGDISEAKGGPTSLCTSFFIQEALPWMGDVSCEVEGKLCCHKCHARVGMLKWAGNQCSCGTWIAPAIQLYKKAVDDRYFPKAASKGTAESETSAHSAGGAGTLSS